MVMARVVVVAEARAMGADAARVARVARMANLERRGEVALRGLGGRAHGGEFSGRGVLVRGCSGGQTWGDLTRFNRKDFDRSRRKRVAAGD